MSATESGRGGQLIGMGKDNAKPSKIKDRSRGINDGGTSFLFLKNNWGLFYVFSTFYLREQVYKL